MMKLGEYLLKKNVISREALDDILKEHEETSVRVGDIVLKRGYLKREQIAPLLAEFFQLPFVDVMKIYKDLDPKVVSCIPQEWAYRLKTIAINRHGNVLQVAIADPLAVENIDMLRIVTGFNIECSVAIESDIHSAIEYCYHSVSRMKEHVETFIGQETRYDIVDKIHKEEEQSEASPVVQYVKSLMIQAASSDVSDIMIQHKDKTPDLRFRIDGILYDQEPPPREMIAAITSHIKILAGLNIAEKRIPQDGRFKIQFGDRNVDVRVSTLPTIYGESVVIRLLNSSSVLVGFDKLGFSKDELTAYRKIIQNSYGLILVTGPTGSGKTTTLYSTLKEIESRTKHIITMEDPVEYQMPEITQSQVNKTLSYNFADGLRAILRQSPDIILVGEIRDRETAEIAIHAALTGHLVFATLHTNDAASAPVRLINMGVESYLITSCLLGVLAQRLIRKICPKCKVEYSINDVELKHEFLNGDIKKVYRSTGCDECMKTGYKGRKAIYEILIPNEKISQMILKHSSSADVKEAAIQSGMKTLRQHAIQQFFEGNTTLEEVLRLTQEVE